MIDYSSGDNSGVPLLSIDQVTTGSRSTGKRECWRSGPCPRPVRAHSHGCHHGADSGQSGLLVAVEHAIEIAIQGQSVPVPLGDTGIGHGTVRMGLRAELRLGEGRLVCLVADVDTAVEQVA